MGGRVVRHLGLEATSKGFCFVVLEDTERLIDWGGREVKGRTSDFIDKLTVLLDRYRPDVVVFEEPAGSRKGDRVREWLVWAEVSISEHGMESVAIARDAFQSYLATFGNTKRHLAVGLARLFPELAPLVPPGQVPNVM